MRLRASVDNGALRLSPLYYDGGQQVAHSGRPHAKSIIFNRGRSVAMWTFTGRVFYPLNGCRPSYSYGELNCDGLHILITFI